MDFEAAKAYILHRLEHELDTRLVYHSYVHTVDVFQATSELSFRENIGEEDQRLVETAALYHDAGMLIAYKNHEENSMKMAAEILRKFNFTSNQIGVVSDLIRSTRLPQLASTTLGNILCDADLDYLGREDFFVNSFRLKLEWQLYGIKTFSLSDWFFLQKDFIQQHTYLSEPARKARNKGKQKNLDSINMLINNNITK